MTHPTELETPMSDPHYSADCAEHHDLVRDFRGGRPLIVVLCGSTRFGPAFQEANLRETMAGRIVLSIGCDLRSDHELWSDKTDDQIEAIKANLDELHKRKIDLADEVLILNMDGYIGDSTRSELAYARSLDKPVRFLESIEETR